MKKIVLWILIGLVVLGIAFAAFIAYEMHQAGRMIVKKPALYLYPIEDSLITVQVNVNGELINAIPEYENGWTVWVTKDGMIEQTYDYLFYEAQLHKIDLPNEGWVVAYADLESWFDEYLIKFGLNEKEKNQFKDYWLNELPTSKYYEIKLLDEQFLDENMNLIISPKPDTKIRLNFYFTPLKEEISIPEPNIITPERNGFTVIEWGGILEK
ncbi:hypothetical protein C4573_03865 [Candidatus Woesearchaeota archaeon]|nr:MAG: hypothetical protein C4573_03865 [Candidatus Woesearchaeota archaeon]